MDGNGIPLSMCITSGSDNEQTTAVPLEEKLIKMFNGKKIDPETYKKGPNDVTRFIKKVGSKKDDIKYKLNNSLIDEEEKYDGFYAVATNLGDSAKDILEVCSNRYKIEDCFRIMKINFSARPVYHRKKERIIAHFMVCYISLLIYRLLENILNKSGTHYTIDNVIETLKKYASIKCR